MKISQLYNKLAKKIAKKGYQACLEEVRNDKAFEQKVAEIIRLRTQ